MFDVTLTHQPEAHQYLVTVRAARLEEEPAVRYHHEPYNAEQSAETAFKAAHAYATGAYDAMRHAGLRVGSNLGTVLTMRLEARKLDEAQATPLGEMLGADGAGR